MLVIGKKSVVNAKSDVIAQGKKLLNTKDTSRVQKWITTSVRNSFYLEYEPSAGHLLSYDKYIFVVDSPKSNSFNVKEIRIQEEQFEEATKKEPIESIMDKDKKITQIDGAIKFNQFPKGKGLAITDHAVKEVLNDYPELETEQNAYSWISQVIRKSEVVDENVVGVDGKASMMCCYDNTAFIVKESKEDFTVVTAYKIKKQPKTVKTMIQNFLDNEIAKLKKREIATEKHNGLKIAELELEKAELQLRSLKTRSEAVKKSCHARINAIDTEVSYLKQEIYEIKREKTVIAKGIVYYA